MKWMMKILDTDSIQLDKDDRFDLEAYGVKIETIAHEIVELQGLLSIVLVRKVDLENYAIVSGHLEYFAYLKALEFDKTLPDRIGVFIIDDSELVSLAKDQIEKLKLNPPIINPPIDPTNPGNQDLSAEFLQMNNLLNNLLKRIEQLEKNMVTTDQVNQVQLSMIVALDARIPKSLPMFEALEGILDERTYVQVRQNLSRHLTKAKVEKVMNVLRSSRESGLSISTFSDLKTILDNNKDQQKNGSVRLMSPALCMTVSDDWQ
jgi:hypothetical protein